jgi:pyridoxal phosphate enzyme (YggS family)
MTLSREVVLANLDTIRTEMASAARRAARSPESVRLIAAAKTVPPDAVAWIVDAGVRDIGENYVRELRAKRDGVPSARWHFIGTLQTSSAHHVAELADVVQTLSSERATRRLARRAAEAGRTIDALIEVDFTGARTGLAPQDVAAFADLAASLDGLRLVGLMTLPPLPETPEDARPWFVRLRGLSDELRDRHTEVVELSMGMSLDYAVAIEEGATMVRVGTALFGERTSPA